ncbi:MULTISPECIES: hypothetical protein [unclassified Eikenella]|nr:MULTISPECIES: hypothetical protein [unclassified Eikenella]VDH00569.1 Uncharacterised protein [Helicobacter pametensis]
MAGLVFQVVSIPNKSYLKTIRPSSRATLFNTLPENAKITLCHPTR